MTFAIGHSGTHAGWKKPMGNATPWQCGCPSPGEAGEARSWPKTNAAYLVRCTDCGTRRP